MPPSIDNSNYQDGSQISHLGSPSGTDGSHNSSNDAYERSIHQFPEHDGSRLRQGDDNISSDTKPSLEAMLRGINHTIDGWNPFDGNLENLGTLMEHAMAVLE